MTRSDKIRKQILAKTALYYQENWPEVDFIPGVTPVPVSGRVFDAEDVTSLVDASLDFWLTSGRYAEKFEKDLSRFLGVRNAILCNSGSSANLLAISALTTPVLQERSCKPGDEFITVAAGFPTTVNPIFQNQMTPVFIDVDAVTWNVDVSRLEEAVGPRTKGMIFAHTLGNPFNLDAVIDVARRNDLWVVEDNCDALGATYRGQLTGSFGDLATLSFYPAHHITMGEGGCVVTSAPKLKTAVESFRDWGRDCWCEPGCDNTCGKRFDWQLGDLPAGYDHKYIYSHIGYNLKLTDMQAAVGVSQLKKLPEFVRRRRENWNTLRTALQELEEFFILPSATPESEPSWFGFFIVVRDKAPINRNDLVRHLNAHKIGTRLLFGGNLTAQPAYQGRPYRVVGELKNSNLVMRGGFWIGVYPGLSPSMLEYVVEVIRSFCRNRSV